MASRRVGHGAVPGDVQPAGPAGSGRPALVDPLAADGTRAAVKPGPGPGPGLVDVAPVADAPRRAAGDRTQSDGARDARDADAPDAADEGPSVGRRLHALYGASPGHLAAMLACLLVAVYTVSRLFGNPSLLRIAVWFVGAAIAWDLVGGPLLALVDRGLQLLRRTGGGLALVNHVRAPLGISALLLLLWTPVIFQRSEGTFARKSGLGQDPFLLRWVLVTVGLFALSAAVYAFRGWRARERAAG